MYRSPPKLNLILSLGLVVAGCAKDGSFFGGRKHEPEAPVPKWTPDGEIALMAPISTEPSWLHVSGRYLRNAKGEPVLLRGVNIPDPQHGDRLRVGRSAKKIMAQAVKDLGANVIRVPIIPAAAETMGFFHDPQSYLENHLDPVVDAARDLGVYLIIDLHYVADYPELADEAFLFWRKVAPRYKREPHVLYEIFNEPIAPNDWTTFHDFAQPLVDAIRKMAPDNVVIVGGPGWSLNMAGAAQRPIAAKNVMYAVHVYPRHEPSAWQSELDTLMQHYPVIVTEWGFEQGVEQVLSGTRSGFGDPFVRFLETRQLSWTAWIYDDRWTSRMLTDGGEALTSGEGGMGEVVAEALKRSWSVSKPPTASF